MQALSFAKSPSLRFSYHQVHCRLLFAPSLAGTVHLATAAPLPSFTDLDVYLLVHVLALVWFDGIQHTFIADSHP